MIRIFTVLTAVIFSFSLFAQAPESLSFQTVVRNSNNQLVTTHGIGIRISILRGASNGTGIYSETHSTSTNANGVATIEIGNGTTSDDFSAIDWSNGPYFVKTEIDPAAAGGSNYTITGTSQLLSVPFALHSKTAESISGSSTVMLHTTMADAPDTFATVNGFQFRYNAYVVNGYLEIKGPGNYTMQTYCVKRQSSANPGGSTHIENYHNLVDVNTSWNAVMKTWSGSDWSGRVPLGIYDEFEGVMFPMGGSETPAPPELYKFYITIDGYSNVFIKVDYIK